MIEARKQKQMQKIFLAVSFTLILIALILGAAGLQRARVANLDARLQDLQSAHEIDNGALQAAHAELEQRHAALALLHSNLESNQTALLTKLQTTLSEHAEWIRNHEAEETATESTGITVPTVIESEVVCDSFTESKTMFTRNRLLGIDVLKACSGGGTGGKLEWRPIVMRGGLITDTTEPSAFASAVNSGVPGSYLLRLEDGGREYVIDVALTVHSNQDVRVIAMVNKSQDGQEKIHEHANHSQQQQNRSLLQPSLVFNEGITLNLASTLKVETLTENKMV